MDKLNLTFVKIEQTCFACPSQWDAWTEDGTEYYIRLRHGHLSVTRNGPSGEDVLLRDLKDYDGVMTTQEMLIETGCAVDRSHPNG